MMEEYINWHNALCYIILPFIYTICPFFVFGHSFNDLGEDSIKNMEIKDWMFSLTVGILLNGVGSKISNSYNLTTYIYNTPNLGFTIITPTFPATLTDVVNNNDYSVRIYILTIGTTTSYQITDIWEFFDSHVSRNQRSNCFERPQLR